MGAPLALKRNSSGHLVDKHAKSRLIRYKRVGVSILLESIEIFDVDFRIIIIYIGVYRGAMKTQKSSQKLITKVASKKVLEKNAEALKFYDHYKKASDLMERTDIALGKKMTFKSETGSTLNIEINHYGVFSTTAQKI